MKYIVLRVPTNSQGETVPENLETAVETIEQAKLEESEQLAEMVEEALEEKNLDKEIDAYVNGKDTLKAVTMEKGRRIIRI